MSTLEIKQWLLSNSGSGERSEQINSKTVLEAAVTGWRWREVEGRIQPE